MVKRLEYLVFATILAAGAVCANAAAGAIADDAEEPIVTAAAEPVTAGAVDLTLQYRQEGGPSSGHVRIVLTPDLLPLTLLQARSAAERAFLDALTEPALGDNLSRITVVVRLMPASHPDPGDAEQIIHFVHKGGSDWSVIPGE